MLSSLKEIVKKTAHLKVLYVEDEQEVRDETARFLKKFFPSLMVKSNGDKAWQAFEKSNYNFDIVITDYRMPTMNGDELMRKIKNKSSKTITILMSGISMNLDEEIDSDYKLSKPVDINEFVEFVENYLLERI